MAELPKKKGYNVKRQMVRGSIWAIALRWSVRLTGLVSTVILARLLTPRDYGIVAIASLIVGSVEVFTRTGQYAAIIRHPNPTREHYDSAWTVSLLLGLGLGLIIWALVPLTTAYFHEPQARPVVQVLALRTMMLGTQNIGCAVNIQRYLQFRKQFLFNAVPTLVSFVVTVTGAFIFRNYWALVIGILSQHVTTVSLSYIIEPFRPRIGFSKVREIWSFSIWSLFKGLGLYVNNQVENVAIGGFAGAPAMGRYSVACDVAISPSQELINPMVSVLLPVMAKVQDDKEKRRELYLNVLYWSALICTSTGVGVALVSQDMADLVLGAKWHDVGVLMPWFALSYAVLGLSSSVYSAFDTLGRAFISARLQWMRVIVLAAAVFPVAYMTHSLEAVVITRFIVTILVTPTLFYALSRVLEVPVRDFAITMWRPIAASAIMAAVVLAANMGITFTGTPRLALDMVLGGVSYAAALMLLWLSNGRPPGPEHIAWDRAGALLARLRRLQAPSKIS